MGGKTLRTQGSALLIGINRYPLLAPHSQLYGCVNDVELMAHILQENFGFQAGCITLLKDEFATRDAILQALDTLLEQTGKEDIIVIHYSGHGSQMTDREGDEPDGLDETIVPYDSGRTPHENRDITDDEIYLRLLKLTQVTLYVTLLFDCCHSGTISRDPFGAKSRWVEPDERPAGQLASSPIMKELVDQLRGAAREVGPSGWLPLGQRYVLIAGCRDEESSYEFDLSQVGGHGMQGALTYFLAQELRQAPPRATYREIFERFSPLVTAAYPRQHPQMEGARDRVLFGTQVNRPMRFVMVRERQREQVTLEAGAAHGLSQGSQWAVYPPGTRQVAEDTLRQGLVEISAVRAVSAVARILEEAVPDSIAANSRAVEDAHHYGEMRLTVEALAPAGFEGQIAELRQLVEDANLLRWVEAGQPAEARAYLIEPRPEARPGDPLPQLDAVTDAVWAVVGQDGRLMMPLRRVSEPGVAGVVRDNLEKIARYRQGLVLRNPNPESRLKDKVEFRLKRQKADGGWVPTETEDASGQVVFEEGDQLAAEITNHSDEPIYVSVLDFGLTGAINLLYPVEGASEQVLPGKTIQIGVRSGDEIELYLPDNFPYLPEPQDKAPTGGTETFKLIATTHEADFSMLVQEDMRSVDIDSEHKRSKGMFTPLGLLLNMALSGIGTRDVRRNRLPPEVEWSTVERSFTLQRKRLQSHAAG